jgi:hypothetical protein
MLRVKRVGIRIVLQEKVGEILEIQVFWDLTLCCLFHQVSQDLNFKVNFL